MPAEPPTLTLAQVNALAPDAFERTFGAVVEKTPEIARQAAKKRPFASLENLQAAFADGLAQLDDVAKRAVLNAHPDLGLKLEQLQDLEAFSRQEQAGAGFTALPRETLAELRTLNAQYRERFGFPFIICVKDYPTDAILAFMRARVNAEAAVEFAEALRQVQRIAAHRLAGLIAPVSPAAES
ncbi:MAG: 2-oxo-4-hydroxy-4-carboxy-5-ureidoimidazoline decarboxylase [Opitutales bacterium]